LRGSVTGEEGEGWSTNRFVSRSGRVVIEPEDWNLAYCVAVFKRPLPEGHVVTWSAVLRGTDRPKAPSTPPGVTAWVTVANGLDAGPHTLEIDGKDPGNSVTAARAYAPPGKSSE
jgi:hypothetical protein